MSHRAVAVLLGIEAGVFGVVVLALLFGRSLLRADVDGSVAIVAAVLCVAHAFAALALAAHRDTKPRWQVYPVLALQVPIAAWAVTRGEPVHYVLAALAVAVLVTGMVAVRGRRTEGRHG